MLPGEVRSASSPACSSRLVVCRGGGRHPNRLSRCSSSAAACKAAWQQLSDRAQAGGGAAAAAVVATRCAPCCPPAHLAHRRQHHDGQVLREAAHNVCHLPHAVCAGHRGAAKLRQGAANRRCKGRGLAGGHTSTTCTLLARPPHPAGALQSSSRCQLAHRSPSRAYHSPCRLWKSAGRGWQQGHCWRLVAGWGPPAGGGRQRRLAAAAGDSPFDPQPHYD